MEDTIARAQENEIVITHNKKQKVNKWAKLIAQKTVVFIGGLNFVNCVFVSAVTGVGNDISESFLAHYSSIHSSPTPCPLLVLSSHMHTVCPPRTAPPPRPPPWWPPPPLHFSAARNYGPTDRQTDRGNWREKERRDPRNQTHPKENWREREVFRDFVH